MFFERPYVLLLLIVLVFWGTWLGRIKPATIIVPNVFFFRKIASGKLRKTHFRLISLVRFSSVFLLVLATSRPVYSGISCESCLLVLSFAGFLLETFLANTSLLHIP